jgi:hypothetical protein
MAVHARQTKVGINVATSGSWGTGTAVATAVGAGDGHYVTDDLGVQQTVNRSYDESAGQSFIGSVQTATVAAIQTAIPMFLHYNDTFQNVLWALTMGTGGTAPTRISTTTGYTNTFEPSTSKTGRYATIVRDKSQFISEVSGAKFTGFEVTFGEHGRAEVKWNIIGDTEIITSTINTSTQISALTFPTLGLRAFMDDCIVRFNAQSGGGLAAGDAVKYTNLTVRCALPLDMKHAGGQLTIIEPEEHGFPNFEIDLTFARFDTVSDDYFPYHRDGTRLKGDITFTGAAIDATSFYGLLMQFPNLDVMEYRAPVPGGADQVAPTLKLKALSTTAAPTGMSGVTVPMRVVTTGTSSANPFV